jgi:hypothetical protein
MPISRWRCLPKKVSTQHVQDSGSRSRWNTHGRPTRRRPDGRAAPARQPTWRVSRETTIVIDNHGSAGLELDRLSLYSLFIRQHCVGFPEEASCREHEALGTHRDAARAQRWYPWAPNPLGARRSVQHHALRRKYRKCRKVRLSPAMHASKAVSRGGCRNCGTAQIPKLAFY